MNEPQRQRNASQVATSREPWTKTGPDDDYQPGEPRLERRYYRHENGTRLRLTTIAYPFASLNVGIVSTVLREHDGFMQAWWEVTGIPRELLGEAIEMLRAQQ